jgi:diguanylate cyclase (GGDEF)-like protein
METAEREQRFLAEALRDTAAALNSTLEITEVLDSILSNVERVVPHRAASIMLIEAGIARVARGRGYKELGIWDFIKSIKFRVSEMPNLRWMVETGQPYVIDETRGAGDWISFPETAWVRSNVCAPIIIRGKTSGFINLDSDVPGFFDAVHAERLQAFANQSAIALENARLYRELQQLASTDDLTSLFNRRRFFELGHNEVERSQRFGHPLTLMIMDADHFKQINDTYGHTTGDQVLRAVGRRCRANLRNIDIVARYGGDEFVFLLLESDEAAALPAAQRILSSITDTPFDTDSGPVNMSVSIGMAQVSEFAPDLTTLIKHADQALYRAKQAGRNMICVWEYNPGADQASTGASSTRPVQRPFGV